MTYHKQKVVTVNVSGIMTAYSSMQKEEKGKTVQVQPL
jgi:hypothetical protein